MADRRLPRILVLGVAVATALAGYSLISAPQPTRAAWTVTKDRVVTVQAVAPAPPTAITCVPNSGTGVGSMQLTWTPPTPAPSGYVISFNGGGSQTVTSPSYTLNAGLLSLPGTYSVTVVSTYGSWTSSASVAKTLNITGIGILSFSYTCA